MSFDVRADAYDRFMGRYSAPLAPAFVTFAGITTGQHVLDVGCGPGALTSELLRRAGPDAVTAVDPSEPFVAAARNRHPTVDVRQASAEALPFDDATFDAALAQLVVHFMDAPVAGLREMVRVLRPGGRVAACVWDEEQGGSPLSLFWEAARSLEPGLETESGRPGTHEGHLVELFEDAGVRAIEADALTVHVEHATFEEWWEPFTLGVGPTGAHVASLGPTDRARLRDRCEARLPPAPFSISARAWAARGQA